MVPSNVVPEAVRARLASQRAQGVPFHEAWPVALGEAALHADGTDLAGWLEAFEETRDDWAAAYHRLPPVRLAHAVAALAA